MPSPVRYPRGRPPVAGQQERRTRTYLERFFTSWVTDDPEPTYSELDRCDGLGAHHKRVERALPAIGRVISVTGA